MTTIAELERGSPHIAWRTPVVFGGLRYGCRACLAQHGPDCAEAITKTRGQWAAHMAREHGLLLRRPPENAREAWELRGMRLGPSWTAPGQRTEQP